MVVVDVRGHGQCGTGPAAGGGGAGAAQQAGVLRMCVAPWLLLQRCCHSPTRVPPARQVCLCESVGPHHQLQQQTASFHSCCLRHKSVSTKRNGFTHLLVPPQVYSYSTPTSATCFPLLTRLLLLAEPSQHHDMPQLRSFACNAAMPFGHLLQFCGQMPLLEVSL
jgi:hypothetical protein